MSEWTVLFLDAADYARNLLEARGYSCGAHIDYDIIVCESLRARGSDVCTCEK